MSSRVCSCGLIHFGFKEGDICPKEFEDYKLKERELDEEWF